MSETPPVSPEAERSIRSKLPSGGWLLVWFLMAILLVLILVLPDYLVTSSRDRLNPSNLKYMKTALKDYAVEHGGQLPSTLEALVPKYLAPQNWSAYRYCIPKTGERLDWLYYHTPGAIELIPRHTIVLSSPEPSSVFLGPKTRRVFGGSGIQTIPEADFQRLIREQNPPAASASPER